MNRLLRAAAALLCVVGLSAFGQGVRYDNRVETVQGNVPYGASAPVLAMPNGRVLICVSAGCPTPATIYSNSTLTVQTSNPIQADTQGRWGFWAAAGNYFYQVTTQTGAVLGPYPITLGGTGGGGGSGALVSIAVSGAVNGSNTTFTLASVPASLLLFSVNGQLLYPGTGYTLTGNVVTTTSAPQPGDVLTATSTAVGGSFSLAAIAISGAIDGSNTTYTLATAPTGVLLFLLNGVSLVPGTGYSIVGTTITTAAAPQSGDALYAITAVPN